MCALFFGAGTEPTAKVYHEYNNNTENFSWAISNQPTARHGYCASSNMLSKMCRSVGGCCFFTAAAAPADTPTVCNGSESVAELAFDVT